MAHRPHTDNWPMLFTVGFVILGIFLRVAQFVQRGNLWLDEAMLAFSIVNRPSRALIFSPLEYNQIAPPGYLQFAKVSTLVAGNTEYALRFPAFFFSIAALLLFTVLARRALEPIETPFAVLAFAIAPELLHYSAEVKQYSADVFGAVLLTVAALCMRDSHYSKKWTLLLAFLGLGIVWVSDTSTLVLGGLGVGFVLLAILERDRLAFRAGLVLAPTWAVAILANQIGAHRRTVGGTAEVMSFAWRNWFVPVPTTIDQLFWSWRALVSAYSENLGVRTFGGFCLVVAIVGLVALWRYGRRDIVLLLIGPVGVAVVASAARLYPFTGRLTLFLLPALTIALAAGTGWISRKVWPSRAWVPQIALAAALLNPPDFVRKGIAPPWLREQVSPVIAHIASNRKPGDQIFVYWGAAPAVALYSPRFGLSQRDWVAGGMYAKDSAEAYIRNLDKLSHGSRLWVVFAHDRIPGLREKMLRHLDSTALRIDEQQYPASTLPHEDATTYLFKLGDGIRQTR